MRTYYKFLGKQVFYLFRAFDYISAATSGFLYSRIYKFCVGTLEKILGKQIIDLFKAFDHFDSHIDNIDKTLATLEFLCSRVWQFYLRTHDKFLGKQVLIFSKHLITSTATSGFLYSGVNQFYVRTHVCKQVVYLCRAFDYIATSTSGFPYSRVNQFYVRTHDKFLEKQVLISSRHLIISAATFTTLTEL